MAMTLQFTDGTTTIDLNDGAASGAANTCAIMVDGYRPKSAMAQDTTIDDRAKVNFIGITTGRSRINSINSIFARARQRARTGLGPRCFVQFKYDAGDTLQRSEIIDGAIEIDDSSMGADYASGNIYATIDFTRMPYWEGALTQIPITNTNGTRNTSGLTLSNHASSASCWFTAAGSDIAGDCDAPVQVRLQITTGSVAYVLIGQLNGTNAYTTNGFYQGESASGGLTGTGSSGTSSGGSYGTFLATTGIAAGPSWIISGTTAGYTNGKSVLPVMRFNSGPASMYLQYTGAGTVSEWIQTNPSKNYVVFPPSPLPAVPLDSGYAASAYGFWLTTWNPSSNATLQIDYVALLPTDGLRELIYPSGVNLDNTGNNTIYDDGIEQQTYVLQYGTDKYGLFATSGNYPMVTPGVGQSFYVLSSNYAGSMAIDIAYSAKLYYRPRRRSI